ncbi:MAG: OmpH family outer membrane protein [Flavobacteriales bacterium]|nr:OmpH family outer membrane protein [Flavobacteriales bacterium]
MKRLLLLSLLLGGLFPAIRTHAQRIAFVDTKYILGKMPDYQTAQQELDRMSGQWQKEIDDRWETIRKLQDSYNAEAILLTDDMKASRREDIEKKERDARDLQKKRFGPKGDLFKKREELIQPIQDRIYQAIKEVAGTTYVAIFDIGGQGNNVLFASEKYDKSDSVLRKLGIRPDKDGDSGNTRGGEDEEEQQQEEQRPKEDGSQPDNSTTPGEKPRDTGNSNTITPKR